MKLGKTTEKERYRRYEKIKEDCGKGRRRQKREFNNRNWWEGCKKINRRKRRRRREQRRGMEWEEGKVEEDAYHYC